MSAWNAATVLTPLIWRGPGANRDLRIQLPMETIYYMDYWTYRDINYSLIVALKSNYNQCYEQLSFYIGFHKNLCILHRRINEMLEIVR